MSDNTKHAYESDSDDEEKAVKKTKCDWNEIFTLKISPFYGFYLSVTNGKQDKDKMILFANLRNSSSSFGATKGILLGIDEIRHLTQNLDLQTDLPRFKSTNIRLKGTMYNGKFELQRTKSGNTLKIKIPFTVLCALKRILPALLHYMEVISLIDKEDMLREAVKTTLKKSVWVYMEKIGKQDPEKAFDVLCYLCSIFDIPIQENPYPLVKNIEIVPETLEKNLKLIQMLIPRRFG